MSANQRPRLHVAPPADETFGDLAADFAAAYGLVPDDWQQFVLDSWLSRRNGQWAALSCGLSCPRQNGKNGIIEIRELFGLVGRGEKILHTAHEVKTARKAFKRLQHFFGRSVADPGAKYPELNARVVELRNVNGQEAIVLDNGGSVEIVARSKNSARGFTADVLIMDEAQELSDEDLEALMPTTSAAPLGDPQWIFTGTPPSQKVNGEVFTRTRADALNGGSRAIWDEWSACDPGEIETVDLDSPDVWLANNPALGGRLQMSVVAGERSKFSPGGFARERLGVWDVSNTAGVIDMGRWASLVDPRSTAVDPVAFAIDVNFDRGRAAIAVAGARADKQAHVEVIAARDGTSWVVPMLVDLAAKWKPCAVVVDPGSPAGSLLPELVEAGLDPLKTSTRDVGQACGAIYDAIGDGKVRHLGQSDLDAAMSGVRKRNLGEAWAWDRKKGDITPLVAVTLALWGFTVRQSQLVDVSESVW